MEKKKKNLFDGGKGGIEKIKGRKRESKKEREDKEKNT